MLVTRSRAVWALSVGDFLLAAEAAVLLGFVWVGLSTLPFSTLSRLLNRCCGRNGRGPRSSRAPLRRVTWAVTAVGRRLPAVGTCVVEALAADAMLRRRGYACELRFGVQPPGDGSTALRAHAWIEHRGVVVLGEVENLPDYAAMSRSGP